MHFTKSELNILKNFADINEQMVFKIGHEIWSVHKEGIIVAQSKVEEKITKRFAIADMRQFIGILSSFENPKIYLKEKYLVVSEDQREVKYTYGDETYMQNSMLPDDQTMDIPPAKLIFKLTENDMKQITRLANVLVIPHIAVVGEKGKIFFRGYDTKNSTGNVYNHQVGTTEYDFTSVFATDIINKLLIADYDVAIGPNDDNVGIIKMTSKDVTYYILPLAENSTFGGGKIL